MPTIAGDDAVRATIAQKIYTGLAASSSIDMFNGLGVAPFNFADHCTAGLTDAVFRFWKANGRAPAMMFNDGKPPGVVIPPLTAQGTPSFIFVSMTDYETDQNGVPYEATDAAAVLTVPVLVNAPGFDVYTMQRVGGDVDAVEYVASHVEGITPTRFLNQVVPLSLIAGGVCSNWQLMMLAATMPETIVATDQGMMFDRNGVACIERSLGAWLSRYIGVKNNLAPSITDPVARVPGVPPGPFFPAFPVAPLDNIYTFLEKARRKGSTTDFFLELFTMAMSFIGFYAGAMGLNGLVGGAVNIPNITASLSLASKFGVDTGSLSFGLKVIDLTTGNLPGNTGPMSDGPFDFTEYDPGFIDPTSIDWGFEGFDPLAGLDVTVQDAIITGDYTFAPIPLLDMGTGSLSMGDIPLFTMADVQAAQASGMTASQAQAAVQQRVQQAAQSSGLGISVADISKIASEAMKLAGQWYTLKAQQTQIAAKAQLLSSGAQVTTAADGTRVVTYPDGHTVALPAAAVSVPGASLIPGIPNQYLIMGAGILATVLMR